MATATTLYQASRITAFQLQIAWVADTLDTALASFAADSNPIFEDQTPNDRPVGDWLVLIEALAERMPSSSIPLQQFNQACDLVARMCMAGWYAQQEGLITAGQALLFLQAWNNAFAT